MFLIVTRKHSQDSHCRSEGKEAGPAKGEAEFQCSPNKGLKQSYGSPKLSSRTKPFISSRWPVAGCRLLQERDRTLVRTTDWEQLIDSHSSVLKEQSTWCIPASRTQTGNILQRSNLRALSEGTLYRGIGRVKETGNKWWNTQRLAATVGNCYYP